MKEYQLIIIGGGSAGIAAALGAYENGLTRILVIERDKEYGGILQQCIHNGFGLHTFKEELSGPAYAEKYYSLIKDNECIEFLYDAVVTQIKEMTVTVQSEKGLLHYRGEAIVLATGCRERPAGAIGLRGDRCEGVYTAGTAQKYLNRQGYLVGKNVFILGSGDIGLIMARRMTLEGAEVKVVCELMPYSGGLARNIEQCLNDYHIPLHLSHTVVDIRGRERLTSVVVARCDEHFRPILGTEEEIPCDTLILSVGLIPENELSLAAGVELDARTRGAYVDEHCQTRVPGIFAAGNVLHVHDLVDFVSLEAEALADSAAEYLLTGSLPACPLEVKAGANVGHVIPQRISGTRDFTLSLRVRQPLRDVSVVVRQDGREVLRRRMRKALPAEMIQLPVRAAVLAGDADMEVCVE